MIIGIDLDDTLTNHCQVWFDAYNKDFKRPELQPLKVEDAYKWTFYDDWEPQDKKNLMTAMNSEYYFDNLALKPDAQTVIKEILDSDNKVIIISATSEDWQPAKKNWLLKQLPMLTEDDIIFTKQKDRINVDIMIDDNLEYASKFTCPFLLFTNPWNINRPNYEYSDNIVRVANWKDIEEYLKYVGGINVLVDNSGETFSEATVKLIKGIKEAKTDKECIDLLNPYIKLWQQQGMVIGMKQVNDATVTILSDIIKEMNAKK